MKPEITVRDGICRAVQPNGKTLAWSEASGVGLIERDGLYFKDLARCGELLPYEDWRLPSWERAMDLARRLSIEEIAGLMLYSPHQMVPPRAGGPFKGTFGGRSFEEAGCAPWTLSDQQKEFLDKEHIRHLLLTQVADARTSAKWSNELQKRAEALPFGIPVNLSSDPRNGARASGAEFKSAGGDVSKWPEGVGFAACFDPSVVRQFAEDASKEYRALGIATALGPQIDLCTEPRWMRFMDTLGEEVSMSVKLTRAYCDGMQTTAGEPDGWGRDSVNTMVKHWPGGGTGEGGRDAHYPFGAYNVYPTGNAPEHLRPFTEGAFHLDGPTGAAAAVMPYYSVSWGVDEVGNSYSPRIIRDMLRGEQGYRGVVCTDWGITGDPSPRMDSFGSRCYGVEKLSEAERHLLAILNGVDQFGGNSASAPILEAYRIGCERHGEEFMRRRMELSAARLLNNIFHCGLFEDPYLDPEESAQIVGCEAFWRHGLDAQHRSVVLLKNRGGCLPLEKGLRIYVPKRSIRAAKGFFRQTVPAHEEDPAADGVLARYGVRVDSPEDADVAIVFVNSPESDPYSEEDVANGGNGYLPITLQYRPYTAVRARAESIAGGDFRENFVNRSYRGKTNTASNEADLDNILECRRAMGGRPVIVCATLSNPMVMREFESAADAIVVDFGVSRGAVLDVVFGDFAPTGRLPLQIPRGMDAVEAQNEDRALDMAVHVDEAGNAYDYGFGLGYRGPLEPLRS